MEAGRLARAQKLLKWILGHAVEACPPENGVVRVRVGEHVFTERRFEFPSDRFIAEIALCIEASGEFSRDAFDIADFDPEWVCAALRIFSDEKDISNAATLLRDANLRNQYRAGLGDPADVFMFMGERMP